MNKISAILLAGVATFGFASATFAADLIIEEPMMPGIVEVSGGDWEGLYLGVYAGYGWSEADHVPAGGGTFLTPDGNDFDLDGFMLGATVGANAYLADGIIGGVAADIAWSNASGTGVDGNWDLEHTINWQGSLRGVLGFDAGAFMPYLTAGLAVANATREDFNADLSASATHIGWTAGVGVQVAVSEDMSLDLQYRYSDFGSQEYEYGAGPDVGLTQHAVTAGLNWKF